MTIFVPPPCERGYLIVRWYCESVRVGETFALCHAVMAPSLLVRCALPLLSWERVVSGAMLLLASAD